MSARWRLSCIIWSMRSLKVFCVMQQCKLVELADALLYFQFFKQVVEDVFVTL